MTTSPPPPGPPPSLLAASGAMADRVRAFGWAATPLGDRASWPDRLVGAVDAMLASPQLATLAVGPERIFLYNDIAATHYGDRHPAALGQPLAAAFPTGFAAVAGYYDRVFAGESLHVPAQPLDTAGAGTPELFDAYLLPIRDPDGRVIAAQMTGEAVGDRKRTEAALRESEQKYQSLFTASPVPFMVLAADPPAFTVTEANDAYLAATLTTREGLVGRSVFDVLTDDPGRSGQPGSAGLRQSLDRVMATRRRDAMVRTRHDIVRPDGGFEQRWWLAIHAPVLDDRGEVTAIIHQVTNETALQFAEVAEQERRQHQAFLLGLSDALRPLANPAAIKIEAMRVLGHHLGVARAQYYDAADSGIVESDGGYAHGVAPIVGRVRLDDFGPHIGEALRAGATVAVDDVAADPRTGPTELAAFTALGVRAYVAVPLRKEGRFVGALSLHHADAHSWTAEELALASETAERTWDAVERARADAALRASEATLADDLADTELLRGVTERLITHDDVETIYDELLAAAMTIARADAGTIQLFDPDREALTLLTTHALSRTVTDRFALVDASSGTACGVALKTGRSAYADFDDRSDDDGVALLLAAGIHTALAIPLIARSGRQLGMLNPQWRAPGRRATERQLRYLQLIARQAADLIEQRQAQAVLRAGEERFRRFGEASQDILWIRDARTLQWTYLTPAFEAIYGLPRDQATAGDDYRNWQALILPEDRAGATAAIARVRNGEQVTFEYRIRRPSDGAVRWLRDTDFPITDDAGHVVLIGGIGRDFTDERRLRETQETLLAELQHRVRNILAVTRSIVRRSDDGERSTEDYVNHLEGRISALARTQVLLTRTAGAGINLENLIREELLAQIANDDQFTLAGPEILLSAKAAEVLTLAIHELATNANKYGAFTLPHARLDIAWRTQVRDDGAWLLLDWIESGVPIADPLPTRTGFGAELVSRRIPYELNGAGEMVLTPDGLHSRIAFPLAEGDSILRTDGIHA